MHTIDTVVIGAGHAGLAVSRLLTEAGRDHVVLDRGRVGERWRTERWDSLHLLTPSWMTRLPGWSYAGPRPGRVHERPGVRHAPRAATPSRSAPRCVGGTTVRSVGSRRRRGRTASSRTAGTWRARNVVVATGPHGTPHVPAGLDPATRCSPSNRYRNPAQLHPAACSWSAPRPRACRSPTSWPGPAARSSSPSGGHTRMPRRYRGMDVFWWLESTGRLARTIDDVADPAAARREPSLQLVGRNGRRRHRARPRPGDAAGRRRPAGRPASTAMHGRPGALRRGPAPTTWPPPTRACTGSSTHVDAYVDAPASAPRSGRRTGRARLA